MSIPKNLEDIVEELKTDIVSFLGDQVISLYAQGSFLYEPLTEKSDIDTFGIVKSGFDFAEEKKLNKWIKRKFISKYGIDVSFCGVTLSELNGGEQEGFITWIVPLNVFIKALKNGVHFYGKNLDFDAFSIEPADPMTEARVHIKDIRENYIYTQGVWKFRAFIKRAFYLARTELQLRYGYDYIIPFNETVRLLAHDENHVVHDAMRLRKSENISEKDIEPFIKKIEEYSDRMERIVNRRGKIVGSKAIAVIGLAGSGKTTVSEIISNEFNVPIIDYSKILYEDSRSKHLPEGFVLDSFANPKDLDLFNRKFDLYLATLTVVADKDKRLVRLAKRGYGGKENTSGEIVQTVRRYDSERISMGYGGLLEGTDYVTVNNGTISELRTKTIRIGNEIFS